MKFNRKMKRMRKCWKLVRILYLKKKLNQQIMLNKKTSKLMKKIFLKIIIFNKTLELNENY